jgi:hypothetical protein
MKFNRCDRPYEEYATWSGICPEGSYKTVSPDRFEGLLPEELLSKTHSVLVIASGSPQASVFVANLNRVDSAASAVDQEPYIVAFNHAASAASGGFVHHGNWSGRTTLPGETFFAAITASGIQAYYPLQEMPIAGSGSIDDLDIDSQKEAFWICVKSLDVGDQ